MKQVLQNFKTGKIELTEVPMPAVKPGFVLVKNYYSLISPGTEREVIKLAKKNIIAKAKSRPDQLKQVFNKIKTDGLISAIKRAKQKIDEPFTLGYSSAGDVIKVGQGAEEFQVSDRVACAGGGYACHAEIIAVPKNLCVKIPENVSHKEAAFATLGAIALQGIRRANLTLGEKIAVIGLGLIGQLTCQILKAYGFSVIGIDKEGLPAEVKNIVDAVIITAATKSNQPIELAGRILRDKGRVSVVGDVKMNVPRKIYYKKELDLFIARSYGPGRYDKNYEEKGQDYPIGYVRWTEKRNMEEFLRLVSKKLVQPEKIISHIFDIEKAQEAYKLILENPNKEKIVAVLFSYKLEKEQSDILKFPEIKKLSQGDVVNIGLIGAGNFAQNIIVPILNKMQNVHIRGVADTTGINSQRIARVAGNSYATTDWHKIIQDKNIDLVIIATRHNLHARMVIEALKNNKNVHVEKPLCLNQKELEEITKPARESKGRLMVGFNRRFSPLISRAKELFRNMPITILCRVNARASDQDHWLNDLGEGGGRIIGEACHFVDLCRFLADSLPKSMSASQNKNGFNISIDFKNDSQAIIIYANGPENLAKEYIEIISADKAIKINNFKISRFKQDKGHFNQFASLIRAAQAGGSSPIPLPEIILSMQMTFDAVKSIQNGTKISY